MTIPRIPDPGPDDDARVQAAVIAFAERELAAVALEPITATEVARGRGRAWFALVGVAAVAVTLVGSQLLRSPIPATPVAVPSVPTPSAGATLAQCLAGLTHDDVVPGSANLSVGELRIVGYVVTRYEAGRMTARNMATKPVPVIASDDGTGEAAEARGRASEVVWQAVEPDGQTDFLTETDLERWVNPESVVPVKPGTMIQAAVFQMAQVTVTLQVRCGEAARDITVTGTNNPVIPGRTTSSLTGIDCAGPDAELPAGYSAEFIAFARTCHTLV